MIIGRRRTTHLAHALKLPERYQEAAMRFYNLALTNNFTKGRRTEVVAAVCLYVVCRQEKSSQMLIDFSDLLQVSYSDTHVSRENPSQSASSY